MLKNWNTSNIFQSRAVIVGKRIILVKIVRTTGVSFIVQRDQLLLISTIHETQKSLRATTARGLIGDISAANASSPPTAPFLPHSSNSAYQNIRAKFSTKKTQKYTGNALERNDQSGYLAVQPAKKENVNKRIPRHISRLIVIA